MAHDAERLKRQVDDAAKLIEALERAHVAVPPTVKRIIDAMQTGEEIAMSANEASHHLAKFIKDMDKQCGIGDPSVDQDDAWMCLAKREHTEGSLGYTSRVNFVLNINNPKSVVAVHWSKMKRSGWACVWNEIKSGNPSGLYRKCFIPEGSFGHLPRSDSF